MGRKNAPSISELMKELSEGLQKAVYSPNMHAYEPHEKQRVFHTSNERIRLYIGGNRSGKTTGGILEDIWWLTKKHPYRKMPKWPIAGRIISVDFVNGIQKIIIPQLKQWIPESEYRGGSWEAAYDKAERVLHFANGSFVELMSYDQDLDKFAGTSRDFVHFDEEPPKSIYKECKMRLIDRKGSLWFTMTPVEGMTWIHDDIYQPGILGDKNIKVIEVDMTENPHLDQTEIDTFLSGLDENDIKARKQGKFVQMGGLVYKLFDPKVHLIDPVPAQTFADPRKYKIYMSLDHGFNNPTAVLWHAVDTDGTVITFDEHYDSQKTIDYHSKVIHQRNKDHGRVPDTNICDPALEQKQAVTGTSIRTEYAIRGIGFALGNNDVITGVAKVSEYLEVKANGRPNWYITQNCANLIKEIQKLRWTTWATAKQRDQNNPYDKIHKKDDHACDSARYFFSFMPNLKPTEVIKPPAEGAPVLGKSTGVVVGRPNIDPNLTPKGLRSKMTEWTKVVLNDD